MYQILFIGPQSEPSPLVVAELRREGSQAIYQPDLDQGLQRAMASHFAVVVIDASCRNGFESFELLRERRPFQRILLLTQSSTDIVRALDLGADDGIAHPMNLYEFLARLRALLRRPNPTESWSAEFKFGDLTIDATRRRVAYQQKDIELTALEFDVLLFLACHAGSAVTRDSLLRHVWGSTSTQSRPTVTAQVRRLRAKIEPDPQNPRFIQTVSRVGYTLRISQDS